VEVESLPGEEGWASSISPEDAKKLDAVREALRAGDLFKAKKLANVYKLTPVAA